MHAVATSILVGLAFVAALGTGLAGQAPTSEPAYVLRGKQTETRQRALRERVERLHQRLTDALRRSAPGLQSSLEPAPAAASGYQLLPRLVPDREAGPPAPPVVARYGWNWSDTLIAREVAALDKLDADLSAVPAGRAGAQDATYRALVDRYKAVVGRRRLIDSDIDYNWLWQNRIAANRTLFDRLTGDLDASAARQSRTDVPEGGLELPPLSFDTPQFVRIDHPTARRTVVTVPLYTDILEADFVDAFAQAVEGMWQAQSANQEYALTVVVTRLTPASLYCAAGPRAGNVACAPPAPGARIDATAHVARFPQDGAVLTTGTASLQFVSNRAIVLGPHDLSARTAAHEFGHVLGMPDSYLRGYRDRGDDGFEVLELVPDRTDLMCNISAGSVQPRHFEGLVIAKRVQKTMTAGLAALYQQEAPVAAVVQFRDVLTLNPNHYGATLQLARALDRAGMTTGAVIVWQRVLQIALAASDTTTALAASERLGEVATTGSR